MYLTRFFLCLVLLLPSTVLRAEDLLVAVLEFNSLLDSESLANGLGKINLVSLEGEESGKTGGKESAGATVLHFSRQPLLAGNARFSSYVGPAGAALDYSRSGNQIQIQLAVKVGRDAPLRKVVMRKFQGSAPLVSGTAQVVSVQASQNTQASSGKDGYKRTQSEKTRVLLVQRTP